MEVNTVWQLVGWAILGLAVVLVLASLPAKTQEGRKALAAEIVGQQRIMLADYINYQTKFRRYETHEQDIHDLDAKEHFKDDPDRYDYLLAQFEEDILQARVMFTGEDRQDEFNELDASMS